MNKLTVFIPQTALLGIWEILDLKRKIRTWTGIWTLDFPVQVPILLLKSKIVISRGTNYKFVSTYQFGLKHQVILCQHFFQSINLFFCYIYQSRNSVHSISFFPYSERIEIRIGSKN